MRQREPMYPRRRGEFAGLPPGGVFGLTGASGVIVGEGGIVDQQIRVGGDRLGGRRRAGVAGVDEPASGSGVADNLLGVDHPAVIEFDRLAVVEFAVLRARRNTQLFLGLLAVESTGTVGLDERVANGCDAVVGLKRTDGILIGLV